MLPDTLWSIMADNAALIISILSILIAILALRVSFKQLKAAREQLQAEQENLEIQKQQLSFGRDFAKHTLITDGSLQLKFLKIKFTGPSYADSESVLLEELMPQTAFEADITIENISSSDALLEDFWIVPKLRFSTSRQNWFVWRVLGFKWRDSEMVMSLKDHDIIGGSGHVIIPWRTLAHKSYNFGDKRVWDATICDTDTGERLSFTKPVVIPRDGRKRIWKLHWGIHPEFYKTLVTEYGFYFSEIVLMMLMDIGNLRASYEYPNLSWVDVLLREEAKAA
jgi:uncharacterized membrane-anchored protein YhcB (DUF1043 family)